MKFTNITTLFVSSLFFSFNLSAAIPNDFVRRCGTEFCIGDKTFYFAGTNVYDFFTYGDGADYTDSILIENQFMDKMRIDEHMERLANNEVKVVRLWMFSHEKWHGFESTKGDYSESEFRLFDYVIESARKNGIYLIPTIENYWEAYGGIDKRLSWEGLSGGQVNRWKFFNQVQCPGCFDQYKNYIAYALNRINHYSGISYKDDPVIFAWDLMNEPRYENASPNENESGITLRAWVDTMSSFIKSIDKNHMVCAGLEAHESRFGFGGNEGNPFIHVQRSEFIDFTSAHPYPTEPWADLTIDKTISLIKQWITESRDSLGKPFFMGEFNVHDNHKGTTRSQWWKAIFDEIEKNAGAGSAFWWYSDKSYDPNFGVWEGKTELDVFRKHSSNMQAKSIPVRSFTSQPNLIKTSSSKMPRVLLLNLTHKNQTHNTKLYDLYGRTMHSDRLNPNLPAGVYILNTN